MWGGGYHTHSGGHSNIPISSPFSRASRENLTFCALTSVSLNKYIHRGHTRHTLTQVTYFSVRREFSSFVSSSTLLRFFISLSLVLSCSFMELISTDRALFSDLRVLVVRSSVRSLILESSVSVWVSEGMRVWGCEGACVRTISTGCLRDGLFGQLSLEGVHFLLQFTHFLAITRYPSNCRFRGYRRPIREWTTMSVRETNEGQVYSQCSHLAGGHRVRLGETKWHHMTSQCITWLT